jgi:hypothetical protein
MIEVENHLFVLLVLSVFAAAAAALLAALVYRRSGLRRFRPERAAMQRYR